VPRVIDSEGVLAARLCPCRGRPVEHEPTQYQRLGALVPRVTDFAVLLRLVWHGGGAGQPGSEPGRINRSGHQDRCTAILTG